jgi:hypothetical protein
MMIVCACLILLGFKGIWFGPNLLRLNSRETNVDRENRLIHHELPEPVLFENAPGLLLCFRRG